MTRGERLFGVFRVAYSNRQLTDRKRGRDLKLVPVITIVM